MSGNYIKWIYHKILVIEIQNIENQTNYSEQTTKNISSLFAFEFNKNFPRQAANPCPTKSNP
jgi:hypothetical protein